VSLKFGKFKKKSHNQLIPWTGQMASLNNIFFTQFSVFSFTEGGVNGKKIYAFMRNKNDKNCIKLQQRIAALIDHIPAPASIARSRHDMTSHRAERR
jgi:hypothetical protein